MAIELFLDANAHLPMCPDALKALSSFNSSLAGHGHPMSPGYSGIAAAGAIERAREKIASLLGCSPESLFFASSCTQACEWALRCIAEKEQNIMISAAEHPAVKQAAKKYFKYVSEIAINKDGEILPVISDVPVACIALQNEVGTIQDLKRISSRLIFSDMCQMPGKEKINFKGIDFAAFGAHKFGGPAGLGILYIDNTSNWTPFGTGSRYLMDRTGTPDTGSIVAAAAALEWAMSTFDERRSKMILFNSILETGLKELGIEIVGSGGKRTPGTTFVKMGPDKGLETLLKLGEAGVHVGLGSACGASYTGSSPLMTRMGHGGGPHDYMRISQFGEYGAEHAEYFLLALKGVI